MPKLEWALCCENAYTDENKKDCIIGLFHRIFADSFPMRVVSFFTVSQWTGDPDETFKERTRIIGPDGCQVCETPDFDVTASPEGRTRIVRRFEGIKFSQPGLYGIEFLANNRVVGSTELTLATRK